MSSELYLFLSYRGAERYRDDAVHNLTQGFLSLSSFFGERLDYFANPVGTDLMCRFAQQGMTEGANVSVYVDSELDRDSVAGGLPEGATVRSMDMAGLNAADLGGYDAIRLVYPDPLGLSYSLLESKALKAANGNVAVVNGRGRTFRLSAGRRIGLAWRRTLSIVPVLEAPLGLLLLLASPFLALWDRSHGRS